MKHSLVIIGGGNMGSAILSGIPKEFNVSVCEEDEIRAESLINQFNAKIKDISKDLMNVKTLLLAVKPQDFEDVLEEIRPYFNNQLIISIAAGITTSYIEKRLGSKVRVVRVMPNLPAQVNEGMAGICKGEFATDKDIDLTHRIFDSIGKTVVVDEKWMDAITAVSGSGPAYVFLFIECFEKAARSLGLKEDMTKQLVQQTLKGSLRLLESQKIEAGELRARVTSKGGTTQAAMDIFAKRKIEKVFEQALKAAARRAKELAK